jgi:glycosyltransferase involved in cell wall biosynthesis
VVASSSRPDAGSPSVTGAEKILIVAPWLQGGGAQTALAGILSSLPGRDVELIVLFGGNRNHEGLKQFVGRFTEFGEPKSPRGVWSASRRLRPHLAHGRRVYSLMRASHLVLGLLPRRVLRGIHLAGSFHQYPSHDRRGVRGRAEDLFVKRATRSAELLTSPSVRAVEELTVLGYVQQGDAVFEPNIVQLSSDGVAPIEEVGPSVRLLFAGRLTDQKGLDRVPALLEATSRPSHIRIAGDGEARLALETAFASVPSRHTVEFLGHRTDMRDLIDWSDALFLPSRWELNPVIIWEGWARGKATLGWDIDALRDLGSRGPVWLFGSAVEFAQRVEEIVHIDTRRKAQIEALASITDLGTSRIVSFLNG